MRTKSFLTVALLVFVAAAVGVLAVKEYRVPEGIASPVASSTAGDRKIVAYYFHARVRCVSCVKIEALSRKAITEGFPEELKNGRLEFRDVNVEEPANRHFIDDYRLVSQSLVLVEFRNGQQVRWRNLEKVWTLLGSEREFIPYVQGGVSGLLKSA